MSDPGKFSTVEDREAHCFLENIVYDLGPKLGLYNRSHLDSEIINIDA